MLNNSLKYFVLFIICLLSQVLIFNQIILFHVAIPLAFIYFLIRLPINLPLQWLFVLAFILGLSVDLFSDTPGVNALACTLIAAVKRPLLYAYINKDDITERIVPCVATMGIADYSKFLLSFVVVYCFLAFTIEYFSFADVKSLVIITSASSLFTFIILLAVDCLIPNKS